MADAHANFATSLVATAPSPATSGTSLVVTTGEGALFPAVPFNATICPAATAPTTANAEIVRVTARSTDTLTITRAQESSSARTVVVGDQIFASITAKTLTDAEAAVPVIGYTTGNYYPTPNQTQSSAVTMTLSQLRAKPFRVDKLTTFDRIAFEQTTVGAAGALIRLGIYADNGAGAPGVLTLDAGTSAADAGTGMKTITISQALAPGIYWLAAVCQSATSVIRNAGPVDPFHYLLSTNAPANYASSVVECFTVNSITGALPNPFGTAASAGAGSGPAIWLRAA